MPSQTVVPDRPRVEVDDALRTCGLGLAVAFLHPLPDLQKLIPSQPPLSRLHQLLACHELGVVL